MKNTALLLTLALWLVSWCAPVTSAPNTDFRTVPLQNFPQQQRVQVQQLDPKKPLYIKMWASWCQPCMQQMPHFQKLYQQFGDKINFIAVNIDINEQPAAIDKVIRQFGLTMPVWRDIEGKLAVQLGLVGTPFSVLLNPQGEQVYSTHDSDQVLDGFLARLAQGQQLPPATTTAISAASQQQLLQPFLTGEHFLFITATWCDWYLTESRPAMAAQCQHAQQQLNRIAAQLPQAHWVGIVNHLWTDDKALAEFNNLYQMKVPFQIDQHGVLFQHFNVRQIPVILKVTNGKVTEEISDFSNIEQLIRHLTTGSNSIKPQPVSP